MNNWRNSGNIRMARLCRASTPAVVIRCLRAICRYSNCIVPAQGRGPAADTDNAAGGIIGTGAAPDQPATSGMVTIANEVWIA